MSPAARKRLVLIDADIVAYQAAASGEDRFAWEGAEPQAVPTKELPEILSHAASAIQDICVALNSPRLRLCLSCPSSENFRRDILPEYKANRGAKPLQLVAVKDWMRRHYRTVERPRLEADDLMGMLATSAQKTGWPTWIASIDKDLGQIPGNLYHPGTGVTRKVTPEEGDYLHLFQTLTGDSTDNYKGCPGIGPKKAERLLHAPNGERLGAWSAWQAVVAAFEAKGLTEDDALVQARVARILQHGDYNDATGEIKLWSPSAT